MSAASPPAAWLDNPTLRFLLVDFLRRLVPIIPDGVIVTSWWRSERGNIDAGGQEQSQHLYALAADFTGTPVGLSRLVAFAPTRGLIAIKSRTREGVDMVHVQRFQRGLLARAGFAFPPTV